MAPPTPPAENAHHLALMEQLVEAVLAAQRSGRLVDLVQQRPRLTRWVLRRHSSALRGSAGDLLDGAGGAARAAAWLLQWCISQLRPDRANGLADIGREAWLNQTSWRPMLALACHNGLLAVPAFPDRYHRRPDEAALDNLCGLWGVGPSTVYRYLDKGRHLMAQALLGDGATPEQVLRRLSLRAAVLAEVEQQLPQPADRNAWHAAQADNALAQRDAVSALWHLWRGQHLDEAIATVAAQAQALATEVETDALVERLAAAATVPRQQFRLWLGRAALARMRRSDAREQAAYDQALHVATGLGDRVLLGELYGALGKFHEPRDADRAFACYEDSVEYLRDCLPDDAAAQALYMTTLVRLAWLQVLRNDPRARTVLDRAESRRHEGAVPEPVLGQLEQTWGEYWRRAADFRQALLHAHRALNLFERVGDQRSVLATYNNLCLLYTESRDYPRALQCGQRVLDHARSATVEPEILASARLNLGATQFWLDHFDEAIEHYRVALDLSLMAELRLHVNRSHFNLAEAYYKRFQLARDPEDERLGDAHATASMKANPAESSPVLIEASRTLKAEILGTQSATATATDRLLPEESAVHFERLGEIGRQRAVLAVPVAPEAHVRARLAIAQAYQAIATQEREAALALARRHGLQERFADELASLRSSFERELDREHLLGAAWQQAAGDLLDAERRGQLIRHLLAQGSINKSGCAQLCGVSPATASKHLAAFTERGLLHQTGKGPATRYLLQT
jgi:tetratricopeptide (TPR) repeat protein